MATGSRAEKRDAKKLRQHCVNSGALKLFTAKCLSFCLEKRAVVGRPAGNAACWGGEFTFARCCGPPEDPACWDGAHNAASCCGEARG